MPVTMMTRTDLYLAIMGSLPWPPVDKRNEVIDFIIQRQTEAYDAGAEEGADGELEDRYDEGFARGEESGYQDGYDDGYRDGANGYDRSA